MPGHFAMRLISLTVCLCSLAAVAEEQVSQAAVIEIARPSVDFGVGFHGFTRSFGPTDGTRTVGSWNGGGTGVAVEGSWYPAASASKGFLGNLGVAGEGQTSIGLTTLDLARVQFAARASLVRAGLAVRVPSGRHELLVTAGVSYQSFEVATVSADGATKRPHLYDVGYLGPRLGLGYAVALSNAFSLRARVGFTYTLARGELEVAAFPSSSAFGFDAQLGVTFTVLPSLQLRAGADLAEVAVNLDGSHTAGDLSIGGTLALAVAL